MEAVKKTGSMNIRLKPTTYKLLLENKPAGMSLAAFMAYVLENFANDNLTLKEKSNGEVSEIPK